MTTGIGGACVGDGEGDDGRELSVGAAGERERERVKSQDHVLLLL